eukprot:COSAG02_NODE_1075_length_14754_cov_18.686796_4_plen_178_part_00
MFLNRASPRSNQIDPSNWARRGQTLCMRFGTLCKAVACGEELREQCGKRGVGCPGLVWLLGLGDAAPLWARGWDGPTYAQSSEHRYYTERWKHSGVVRAAILIHLHSCSLCYATAELQRLIRPMQHTLWIKRHPESYADSPLTSTAFHMDALRFRVAECSLLWPRISILVCMTTNVS